MKITKARLKEIIQEELMREHGEEEEGMLAPEEYAAQRQGAGDEMRARVAQHQAGRVTAPEQAQEIKNDLLVLYRKMSIHGPTREIVGMIQQLELELQDLEV